MTATLKQRLQGSGIVTAPGVYDAFSALLVEQAGFQAAYLSGASIAYTRLGRPDIGLLSLEDVASVTRNIRERCPGLPLIVDADTGFGNALNVMQTVRVLERAGATAIQLEDQAMPKRCGHLDGKTVIGAAEMAGKIRAACDARRDENTLIIARTDAVAVEGMEAALARAQQYAEAGADVLFVEALRSREDMTAAIARLGSRAPLLANMVEGGKTPVLPAAELEEIGFRIVIFPGGTVRALSFALRDYLASLHANGTTTPYLDKMLSFQALNGVIGTPEMLALGKQYE
ncbi:MULTISPECIES: isocitrate lyase/phosphoenolpyruvate mutase family protein [unclassified Cupriavidus]|uniref:isocitrate lyase/PEP mutase family protein n=1 Tax=unclassified Cupriavidus TaxID=2640874 RepID=UPI001C005C67|nr:MULTISPECIES: isocitrate lyase/phosphoenolpyruvate mutase family protein [unclassified Cupriavidus]MCA3186605.1 isocitrate lyase/phosphoenolpyruvate mutase family protein [Cupriavidus sp.]MCA3188675.1 isocitrate lyase/phosphoenolpyruvate mutase family protein [Cupriavidus sp.]MCA3199691.1 isocitrate lyase/phosphoenolpyruvate mutase family protein [Cupriavidus sp.]MCA3205165.1 isocitrate lyase/phosphoenolpyruvate mutase family protein [Cupriavidus sp.]MCA3206707.1 isocitrate lyase/phosphoeno